MLALVRLKVASYRYSKARLLRRSPEEREKNMSGGFQKGSNFINRKYNTHTRAGEKFGPLKGHCQGQLGATYKISRAKEKDSRSTCFGQGRAQALQQEISARGCGPSGPRLRISFRIAFGSGS